MDPIAERDQRAAFYTDMAHRAWDFYEAFVRVGFTPDQTMAFLLDWMQAEHEMAIAMAFDDDDE